MIQWMDAAPFWNGKDTKKNAQCIPMAAFLVDKGVEWLCKVYEMTRRLLLQGGDKAARIASKVVVQKGGKP